METFRTKIKPLPGSNYSEVVVGARFLYKQIASKTRRRPYVRSAYFQKDKVFLDYFWHHIMSKSPPDRARRLKQYPCALELVRYTRVKPTSKENPNKTREILHRFRGINGIGECFFVQIKENLKNKQKYLMSMFPDD